MMRRVMKKEENLSLAKEKLGLVSWLLLLLWLLAEPLSLDGDAKGAEIQLPADGDMIAHIYIHGDTYGTHL